MRSIISGTETMMLHDNGDISRPSIGMGPSGQWRCVGAVERNNFGRQVRVYTLRQILDNPASIPWRYKNGSQRTFLCDFDHGSMREWRTPPHHVS